MKRKMIYLTALVLTAVFWSCEKEVSPNQAGALVPQTVDQDPGLPSISVNGTQLHSETFGNPADPMVIYLHGGPGSDYRNAFNIKNLVNNNYYVVFYDQRGSGLSKRHSKDSYTIQVMLDDLTAIIQHYRSSSSQKVFLFGHSWGAMLAAAYINKYPGAVNGAVLAEPGGLTWEQVKEYSEKTRRIKLFRESINDALYTDQFLTGEENEHVLLDYKMALASASSFAKNNEEGIEGPSPFWRKGAVLYNRLFEIGKDEGFDFRNNLSQFNTKVLFLYSENNRAYDDAYALKLSAAFPKVQLSKVNGTGHEMICFKWDNVSALVVPYLNSLR
jgi:proline iminopeptidase